MNAEAPVQRQLDAYNDHDLSRFVAEYADDVRVYRPPALEPVLVGKAAFARHYAENRFNLPALHAQLVNRIVCGDTVVDHERITGLGENALDAIAVYAVADGLIRTVWFYAPAAAPIVSGDDPDADLASMSAAQLAAEIRRLRAGVRRHRDATGHELCWHHPDLWSLLPERTPPAIAVPEWPQFMRGCVHYRQSLDAQATTAPRTSAEFEPTPPADNRLSDGTSRPR